MKFDLRCEGKYGVSIDAGKQARYAHQTEMKRKFHVTLLEHDEGVSISCPELPGCHSQGATVDEALANIEDAIRGYVELYGQPETRCEIREMEVITG
jgi:predicted RNase H-like HicB family nuclease